MARPGTPGPGLGELFVTAIPSSQSHGFLFADLRDYSHFVEAHGDHAAAELLTAYRALVRGAVEQFAGAEIRTEGDSFYVVFGSASSAVRCGVAILEAAAQANRVADGQPIAVGVGVHAGETAETDEGFVGSAVNIAARICTQARAGQLLVSDTVRSLTRTMLPYGFTPVGTRKLKGIAEPIALYRVEVDGRAAVSPSLVGRARRLAGPRLAAAAIVVVAIAIGLVGQAALSSGSQRPSASPSSSTSAVAGASVSPVANLYPNVAERDLLSRLPESVQGPGGGNCGRAGVTEAAPAASASIRCQLDPLSDAEYVVYDQFPEKASLDTFFLGIQHQFSLAQGDCEKQASAWQLWDAAGFSGRLLCYREGASGSRVAWTYDGAHILARAGRGDEAASKLFTWWRETAVLMLR
ncbi:MAG: adenylate/guanylate cyclase domain-containing protein [Chloroflexi bacterium]|nr:MAG: adenylate/guanylate cyclase domain-containing protein [Chloroflexota bacterium]